MVKLLDQNEYGGDIFLIGRSAGEVGGRPILDGFDDLPVGVDLAILILPASGVLAAVKECVRKQIGSAVIFASGFAELGQEGVEAQAELTRLADEAGLGLVGPNTLGFTNYIERLDVNFIPLPPIKALAKDDLPGLAVLAQSGALMGHACQALKARNVPIAFRVATGNEAGLGLPDYIAYMANNPAVSVIALYAEQISRPDAFLKAVSAARESGKNLVLYHTGRGSRAQEAATSHTGALAGDYATIAALARRAGVLVVESLEEWIDCTEALARFPVPPSKGPAVITSSGGFCAIAHDQFEDLGIEIPRLSDKSEKQLAERLPEFTTPKNPLDLTTQIVTDPQILADCVNILLADEDIGSISIATQAVGKLAMTWLEPFLQVYGKSSKPILISPLGEDATLPEDFEKLARSSGLIISRSPERALRSAAALTCYGRSQARQPAKLAPIPSGALPPLHNGIQPEWLGKKVLSALGIACPAGELAKDEDEAVRIASEIGYPIVLKVQAGELAHKTEIGGVVLNLHDEASVRSSYTELVSRVGKLRPDVTIDGVLVEVMAPKGLELVIGAKRDPKWGPVVLVGLGGVMVEALEDVRLFAPDLSPADIKEELLSLKSAKLLGEFRGSPACDLDEIARVVSAVGRLMIERPEVVEVDINPLMAMPEGEGAMALDALIVVE